MNMNPKISLSSLLIASLSTTFIACPSTVAEPTPLEPAVVMQDEIAIKFGKSGRYTWNGELGDTITVTWTTRRGLETRTRTLI